ncbi:PREDICTED: putative F-box protein At4g05475 [Camelina sativa]|uniref:F-box protein At4g05475 n=1 Tax=Camelina sativa TaxID=90675 RepID=A0ABM0TD99_CAMSA|nr:PREDICTED: putative F-box protein At4g05475 [Camelina sativa]
MASSSSPPSGNWAELPPELTSSILLRLSTVEILKNAQLVCRSWRRVCKDPWMFRKIDMRNNSIFDYDRMCRHAVDLSEGGLVEINMEHFGDDALFSYIVERSSNLRCLRLEMSHLLTAQGFVNAFTKLPFLEDLEILHGFLEFDLKSIGQSCPLLTTLKLNSPCFSRYMSVDDEALAIAETMPKLRHLDLFENRLTDSGLNAILDNCLHLEHLDIRRCFNINFFGDLEKRCSERIRDLKRPDDSTADYPFDVISDIDADLFELDSFYLYDSDGSPYYF